jgi:alpha-glucosidase (family GH31 glycosyl hydrolase)
VLHAPYDPTINYTEEYYLHNANSYMGMKRLSNVLSDKSDFKNQGMTDQRIFIFSESTFAGSGNLGGAIITDVYRSWDNLRNTIS